jgi:hypothetical protein
MSHLSTLREAPLAGQSPDIRICGLAEAISASSIRQPHEKGSAAQGSELPSILEMRKAKENATCASLDFRHYSPAQLGKVQNTINFSVGTWTRLNVLRIRNLAQMRSSSGWAYYFGRPHIVLFGQLHDERNCDECDLRSPRASTGVTRRRFLSFCEEGKTRTSEPVTLPE